MGFYNRATICPNGHVLSSYGTVSDKHCPECGKQPLSNCSDCSAPIRGDYETKDIISFYGYTKPSYCYECGNAFPWTKTIIDNAVELVSLDEELPEDVKELIKNALPDLIIDSPTTPVAVAKYKKFVPKASSFVKDGMRSLLIDVVSEATKKSIWG